MKDPERYRNMSLDYQPCHQPQSQPKMPKRRRRVEKLAGPLTFRALNQASQWLQQCASELRTKATPAEVRLLTVLAEVLPRHKLHCEFQYPIGHFILDFFIPEVRLCIELDGAAHFTREGKKADSRRTRWLWQHKNIRVIRFPNGRVERDMSGVIGAILQSCGSAYAIRME